jgi:hypothetical protein
MAGRCLPALTCPRRGLATWPASLAPIDDLEAQIDACERELRRLAPIIPTSGC